MENGGRKKRISQAVYILVIIALWIVTEVRYGYVDDIFGPRNREVFKDSHNRPFSEVWTDEEGNPADLLTVGVTLHEQGKKEATYTAQLPSIVSHDTYLMFVTSNLSFDVSVNGKVIYENYPEAHWFVGKSLGTQYHSVLLSQDYGGEEIQIHAVPVYADSGSIAEMFLGTGGSFYTREVEYFLPGMITSVVIIIIGVLLLSVSYAVVRGKTKVERSYRAFSVLTILVGLWTLEESIVGELFFGHPFFWRAIAYPPLILIPVPLVIMVAGWVRRPMDREIRTVKWMEIGVVLYCIMEYILYKKDFHDCTPVIMGALGVTIGWMTVLFAMEGWSRFREGRLGKFGPLFSGLMILAVSAMMDFIAYNILGNNALDCGSHIRIGYCFTLLLVTMAYVQEIRSRLAESTRAEMFRQMALQDELTRLPNRSAKERRESYLSEDMNISTAVVGSCDLNYLKKMNDTAGHQAGDAYLKKAAEILRTTVRDAYRTGGDEFCFYVVGRDAERQYDELEKRMNALCMEQNVSMAVGTAVWTRASGETIAGAMERADRAMYARKSEMKADRMN